MNFYEDLEKWKDNIALLDGDGMSLSYYDLVDACNEFKKRLSKGKNLIFCFCKNEIPAIVGYISCLQSGNVPLLLNADIDSSLALELISIYHPQYLFNPCEEILEKVSYEKVYNCYNYALVKTSDIGAELNYNLALLLTTSGSTGSPKLVRQSYRNIQSNAEAIAQYLELSAQEKPITTLPMNYTYGLSIINSHLLVGATIILTEYSLMQKEFWQLLKSSQATSFGGVPYTYEMLKKLKFFRMDLPSLKTMTQAGGKLSPDLHREFAEYAEQNNKKFIVMYGQTEATARMAYLPSERALEKYGSMGISIPGGYLWLKAEDGSEIVGADVVGELIYEGPNVTLGYAENSEDLKKGDEFKGVLVTGDMAKKDNEGFFYIVGRKKRFLKIYGNRVNLDEVERMLKQQFEVSGLVCTGVDDKLYIFLEAGNELESDRIKMYLSDKTKLNVNAFSIKVIDQIPKNDAGKVLYRKLEEYYD